jgi:hypothetical protein
LGNVTRTGDMSLTVDDLNGSDRWTIGVTATTIGFSNGTTSNTFDFSGATLSSVSHSGDNLGGNTIDVTGTHMLPARNPLSIGIFAGSGNAVNLGDPDHPPAAWSPSRSARASRTLSRSTTQPFKVPRSPRRATRRPVPP